MHNSVTLIGRLSRDPELKYTAKGVAVTGFNIAVERGYKDKDGKSITDFISIYSFRKLAEIVAQYGKKGRLLLVQAKVRNRTKEHNSQRYTFLELIAESVRLLDNKPKEQTQQSSNGKQGNVQEQISFEDDDLPF